MVLVALSFGAWLKKQRKKHHLTQEMLAGRIHCATVTIRKIEADERHPSQQLAELLAEQLCVAPQSRSLFLEFALSGSLTSWLVDSIEFITPVQDVPFDLYVPRHNALQRRRLSRTQKPAHVQATTIYLLDASADQMLLEESAQQRLKVASTTKIMTALIALEQGNLDQSIVVKQELLDLVNAYQGHLCHLKAGDTLLLKDLLYALMLPSGDDAAFVIADAICGSVKEFVRLMNVYRERLGLRDTHYVNPSGISFLNALDDYEASNYSTAADLVRLAQYATTNALFAQIVQLQRYDVHFDASHHEYRWETVNHLLHSYAGATGVKTGQDSKTDCSMVFSATSGKQQLIGVVLQEKSIQQRLRDARSLLDWGFSQRAQ